MLQRILAVGGTILMGLLGAAISSFAPHVIRPVGESVARADAGIYDWMFAHRGAERKIGEVVVVELNKNARENLGDLDPIPRTLHARLLQILSRAGARVVGFDFLFPGASAYGIPGHDDAEFASALRSCGNAVLAADFTTARSAHFEQSASGRDFPISVLRRAALDYAPADVPHDHDQSVRRFRLSWRHMSPRDVTTEEDFPSFAVRIAAEYLKIPVQVLRRDLARRRFNGISIPEAAKDPIAAPDGVPICFVNTPGHSCRFVAYDDVLDGRVDPALFRGRIVLVGDTEESVHDTVLTPLVTVNDSSRAGVEVQASIIHTLLSGHYYSAVPPPRRVSILWALAVITSLITWALRPWRAAAPVLLMLAAICWVDILLFAKREFLPPVQILAAVILAYLSQTVLDFFTEERKARSVRRALGRFIGPRVMEKVLESGHVPLSGETRHVAVLFADLASFTLLTEHMKPEETVALVNRFLALMVETIFRHEGTLDKMMGDGIMAYFGAPNSLDNPEQNAVECACEMQRQLREWRLNSPRTGLPALRMRIGIHSGEVIVGEVGSSSQAGYTIIGDVVNVASRLEPMNKELGTWILVSGEVSDRLGESIMCKHEKQMPVRGREGSIDAYSIPTEEDPELSQPASS